MNKFTFGVGLALLALIVWGTGCSQRNDVPPWPPREPLSGTNSTPAVVSDPSLRLRVGDIVIVTFSDLPQNYEIRPQQLRIRPDGLITLPYNVTVMAANKTVGELQEEIRKAYVPDIFRVLTVTVQTQERYYYVGGEVRMPSRLVYPGELTVLRAIESAGGFTDFAKRSKVQVIRADGRKLTVNADKARENPTLDPPVFPGDYIYVPRRVLW